jgi:hypothetical protein
MMLPMFFDMRDGRDRVRIDYETETKVEFHISFQNGVTDNFIYDLNANEQEVHELVKGNIPRQNAIARFLEERGKYE